MIESASQPETLTVTETWDSYCVQRTFTPRKVSRTVAYRADLILYAVPVQYLGVFPYGIGIPTQ